MFQLDLSGFGAERISSRLFDLTNLEALNLRSNLLRAVPREVEYLLSLQTLDLSRNMISKLPRQVPSSAPAEPTPTRRALR